jgi:Holliday junction resolvasome RuvABC DNA-binding subunit
LRPLQRRRTQHAGGQVEALFDLGYHTKHVDTVFARVFGAA